MKVAISAPMGEYLAARAGEESKIAGRKIFVGDTVRKSAATPPRKTDARRWGTRAWANWLRSEFVSRSKSSVGAARDVMAAQGYRTAHPIPDRDAILKDEEFDYAPTVGKLDGTVAKSSGTMWIKTTAVRAPIVGRRYTWAA